MKVIIVEDEQSAINLLKEILSSEVQGLEVVGEARNIQEAKKLIKDLEPDLLLLDIELPNGTGFDLLKQLSHLSLKVIFITAHEKYALQAIKMSALDYILKPIDPDELIDAINRVKNELHNESEHNRLKALLNNQNERESAHHKIVLKDKNGFQLFDIQDIIRLEALGSYTQFIINNGQSVLVSKNIKEYDSLLQPHGFFRCHKSHLINLDHIKSYSRHDGETLFLKDESEVPLAIRKKDLLMKVLSEKAHIK